MDLFLEGKFLEEKSVGQYEGVKMSGQIDEFGQGIPKLLIEFYYYVLSLNLNDEINFFHWKNYIGKNIENERISKPYSFMMN